MKKIHILAAALLLGAVMVHAGPETAPTGEDSPEKAAPAPAPSKPPAGEPAAGVVPEPQVDLSERHGHRGSLNVTTDGGARRGLTLPEAEGAACGAITGLGRARVNACLVTNRPDREWESLIIDLNDNKDLTDDPAHALQIGEKVSEIVVGHRGADHRFRVAISHQGHYYSVELHPLGFLEGSGAVGAKTVAWHVADCNLSGAIDEGDAAYITFDGRPWERYRGHMLVLDATSAVREDGRWYGVRWQEEGSGLEVEPFRGEMHTLKVDATETAPGASDVRCHFVRYGMGRSARMFNADLVAGVALPSGRLGYLSGMVKTEKGPVNFVMRGLVLDRDTSLQFGKPSAHLVLTQRGETILVSQNCIAAHNVVYTLAKGKRGPRVEVFAPNDPEKPIHSGNMEYG